MAAEHRRDAVASQIAALNVAYNRFQEHEARALKRKLAETTLEMERARMSAEDARGAMVSPYCNNYHTTDPRYRHLSWREFGTERNDMCDHLVHNVTHPAEEILQGARKKIRMVWRDPASSREAALTAAYNAMCDAEKCLRDNPD